MASQSHSDWYEAVTAHRAELAVDPADLELANRVWELLSGSTGFDVRTGRLVIETFRAAALKTDTRLSALVSAFRKLADDTGEFPHPSLIDPPLEGLLRLQLRESDSPLRDDIQWILDCVEAES